MQAATTTPTAQPSEDVPVLTFTEPLPGLGGLTRFALVPLDEYGSLFSLRSVEDAALRLLLAPTWVCAQDYAFELEDDIAADLGLTSAEQAAVFLVVTPGDSLATSTVNQLAPVVVNSETGAAVQLVLTGTDHAVRAPLIT